MAIKHLAAALGLLLVATAAAAQAPRRPERRVAPSPDYRLFKQIPRGVGATTVWPDMSEGPEPWYSLSTGRPFAETVSWMISMGVPMIGVLQRAHPTFPYYENIQEAYFNRGLEVVLLTPQHWANWVRHERTTCNSDVEMFPSFPPLDFLPDDFFADYPADIFEMLFQAYGDLNLTIVVMGNEHDWRIHGVGCRGWDQCHREPSYDWCWEACEAGTLVPYDEVPAGADCQTTCCTMYKVDRAAWVLRVADHYQQRVMAARARHPRARLRVLFALEANMFATRPWQFLTVSCDVIPKMKDPPDLVGMSLYNMAGDVVEAFNYVAECTGLPANRIFISEVGAREGTQPDGSVIPCCPQYDRITGVVDALFPLGVQWAMVWSFDERAFTGGHTGFAVIDPVTFEELSGMRAIRDLNERWK